MSVVYFIQAKSGPIKIGVTSNFARRLAMLETGSHEPLTLLGWCYGDEQLEASLHQKFSHLSVRALYDAYWSAVGGAP